MKKLIQLLCLLFAAGVHAATLTGTNTVPSGSTMTTASGSTMTISGAFAGTPTGGTLSFANLTFTLPASMTITTPTITNPTFSFGSNGSMTWTAGNGTGTELREVWAAITNTGGNVLGLRNNATTNALATIKGADASGGETFALGSGTNLSSGPLGATNCVFWESNRIDGSPTSSAYPIFILFTGTCGGAIPYAQYVREQWLADGSWAMNDRLGVGSLALNAGGTTLQIGNRTDGGNVASVSAHSNIVMANNTGITLDATSRVSVTNPGIEFGVSGPNMYAPGGGALSIASGLTTGRADAITIDASQNVTFHAGTVFSTGPTVPSLTISAAGLTYLIMKNTTVGSNAQWNEYMDGSGNRVFDYYNGSAYVSPSPMVIGPTGALLANISVKSPVFLATPGAAPGTPAEGQIYENSTSHHFFGYNGSAFVQLDNGTGTTPQVVAKNLVLAASATTSSVATYTTPNDSTVHPFRVGATAAVTAISAGTLTLTATFTDENNSAQTVTFYGMGLTSAGITATGYTGFAPAEIWCKANTAITIVATFTGVSITYDAGGVIESLY